MATETVRALKILLVEDLTADARFIEVLLREVHGSSVEICHVSRLADAETSVRERDFDAILLDLTLPDADRLDTLKRMKAASPDVPVVVLTVHEDEPLAVESLHAGAQDYLPKSHLDAGGLGRALRYAVERHRAETEKRRSEDRLRIASELVIAEQRERGRLASELHDHLAQLLATAQLRVREALELGGKGADSLIRVDQLLEDSLRYTRTLIVDLLPAKLFDRGLAGAMKVLAENMAQFDLEVEVESPEEVRLEPQRAELVYQSVRELLFNVVKHARAHVARVRVFRDGSSVVVEVSDEGAGFDPAALDGDAASSTFGLASIRKRVLAMRGTFELDSRPGDGTRATIRVPVMPE